MNARQRVIAALGCRCAWCQSTTGREIDHLHGGGNQHRAQIRLPLTIWLGPNNSLFHTPTDFVVNQEASDVESGLYRESLLLDNVWTTFCRRIRDLITYMISMA